MFQGLQLAAIADNVECKWNLRLLQMFDESDEIANSLLLLR
jgi:hypothetical protein